MGEYKHTIDAKGRLTIPSKIRNQCQGSIYVTRGLDGCLAFYTKEEWDPFCKKLLSLPSNKKDVRKAIRFTISSACECEFDKLGRINIPTNLNNSTKICIVLPPVKSIIDCTYLSTSFTIL